MLMLPDAFQAALLPPTDMPSAAAWWFVFYRGELLVRGAAADLELPQAAIWPFAKCQTARQLYLGTLHGQPCYAAEALTAQAPPGWQFANLRGLWGRIAEAVLGVASHAAQLIEWDRNHQFCGQCGTPTQRRADERGRRCPSCELVAYPRLSPVVMVRVLHAGQILLARSPRFAQGVYSVLAGFVEAGESVEQAIHRELAEEVGIQVQNLRYFASQSWPFPHSLMLGFSADYAGGALRVDGQEILDAGWFTPETMPNLPIPMSMARHLIDDYLRQHAAKSV